MSGPAIDIHESTAVSRPAIADLAAWGLWLSTFLATSLLILLGNPRSVTNSYRTAALNWLAGQPIYGLDGTGFIYLPHAAILWIPFALLPEVLGEILWRGVLVGAMAWAVSAFSRASQWTGRSLLIASAVVVLGCFSGIRNGQSTILMMALMLLAASALAKKRWALAAALLAFAVAVKPLAVVMLLLVVACYPRAIIGWAIPVAILLGFPFLTQHPDYVLAQYAGFVESSAAAYQIGTTSYWAQLFGLFKVAGADVPAGIQTAVRVAAALGTCLLALKATKLEPRRTVFYLYALSSCFLMLFNPRTENSTYALLAPVFGALIVHQSNSDRALPRALLLAGALATALSFELSRLAVAREQAVWVAPLICAVLSGSLVIALFRESASPEAA